MFRKTSTLTSGVGLKPTLPLATRSSPSLWPASDFQRDYGAACKCHIVHKGKPVLTEECEGCFESLNGRMMNRSCRKISEDDTYRWMSETDMVSAGFTAARIAAIKNYCVRSGDHRKDKYQPTIIQYRVLMESTGVDSKSQEHTVEAAAGMAVETALAFADQLCPQPRRPSQPLIDSGVPAVADIEAPAEEAAAKARMIHKSTSVQHFGPNIRVSLWWDAKHAHMFMQDGAPPSKRRKAGAAKAASKAKAKAGAGPRLGYNASKADSAGACVGMLDVNAL